MADVDQAPATEQAQGTEALTGETVQKMISEALENQKGEIAGLNRKNSALNDELKATKAEADEKVKSTMSDSEKATHDWQLKIEKMTNDLTASQRASELLQNQNTARDKLKEAGVPDEFMDFIPVESIEAIDKAVAKAAELYKKINEAAAAEVGKRLGANAPTPPTADNPNALTREAFEALSPQAQMDFMLKDKGAVVN